MITRANVLVVEDEATVRTTLCASLTLIGFSVHQAPSVDAALKVLGAEHIDAVVLDVRFPDRSGLQQNGIHLLQFLRATTEYAHTPVLIFTGVPLSPSEDEIARKHGAHVFYKPQPYSVLINHLNGLLDAASK